ncbi:putative beta-ketoacyl synthase family protein [Trypanosoma conorhini]|uniref:beta-ketoacyl-[acyl-carrier-protein] synthase I n=1 Tax=Trypanosoma conorhini TaxID=83891 RepID=A0A3R7PGX6_9TRYP|nr:putative beta-ketoacyl synthase family protein [Trypanosoma conorhini]RNF19721.1 putative beta-ketoacyl synthase family protein [Trypanosoma conorhini]
MPFGSFPPFVRRRVVVTGLGAVTPLGHDVASTWAALCQGLSATRPLAEAPFFFPACLGTDRRLTPAARQKCHEQLIASMPCKVAAPVSAAPGGPTFAPTTRETRATVFAHRAVEEALTHAKIFEASGKQLRVSCAKERIGVNIGVGMPSLADVGDVSYSLYADPERVNYSRVNPLFVPKILGNMVAGLTAMKYGITGPLGSGVAACATGAHCIGEAAEWVRGGRADVVVCGGTEACITPVSIAGFSRMRALCTKYNDKPQEASRPFDKDRAGFVMGEGSGVVVLEELEHARQRGAPIFAELRGFGISSDAHDLAAPHPEGRGAQHCLRVALQDGGDVPASEVAYVNAHATGTIGDDLELQALDRVLGGDAGSGRRRPLYVSSVKGGLGHLLGAAGSVEAIVAIVALHRQQAPPNINLVTPSAAASERLQLVRGRAALPFEGDAVVSTSFGFGGVNTALLFTRV